MARVRTDDGREAPQTRPVGGLARAGRIAGAVAIVAVMATLMVLAFGYVSDDGGFAADSAEQTAATMRVVRGIDAYGWWALPALVAGFVILDVAIGRVSASIRRNRAVRGIDASERRRVRGSDASMEGE
jgi:hypothetical protein